jgi:hypothetical protein
VSRADVGPSRDGGFERASTSIADAASPARVVLPLTLLPSTTTQFRDLLIRFTHEKDPEARRLFTSAYLGSHFCLQEWPEPTRALLTPAELNATLDPAKLSLHRLVLQCGGALLPALLSPYVTVVRFLVAGSPVDLRVAQLDLKELPAPFFVPHPIAGRAGYCQPEAFGGCRVESIHHGTMWMFGRAGGFAGDPLADRIDGTYLLVAGSEADARAIETGVGALMTRWTLSLAEAPPIPLVRAIRAASPVRRGRVVFLSFQQALTPAEAAFDARRERWQEEKKGSVVRIFEAIERGRPLPATDVAKLGEESPPDVPAQGAN